MGLSRAALQEEGPESGAIGAKGLRAPGGTTRTHLKGQAEVAEQVFEQGDLLVLPGHGRKGDRLRSPTRAQRLHQSVRGQMTLTKVLKLCRLVSLSLKWGF